ncbi:hypothetical protein ACXKGW_29855, partial [Klebsiella pneumoniae subsp. pneumoniae]
VVVSAGAGVGVQVAAASANAQSVKVTAAANVGIAPAVATASVNPVDVQNLGVPYPGLDVYPATDRLQMVSPWLFRLGRVSVYRLRLRPRTRSP